MGNNLIKATESFPTEFLFYILEMFDSLGELYPCSVKNSKP